MKTLTPAWQITLKAVFAVVVLGILVWVVDFGQILAAARRADPRWIAAAIALLPLNLGLESLLWHRLVQRTAPNVTFGRSMSTLLLGHTFGLITPGRIGEFAGRPLHIPYANKWELGLMVVAHRLFDMTAVVIAGTIALLLFIYGVSPGHTAIWLAFCGAGVLIALFFLSLTLFPGRTYERLSSLTWIHRRLTHLSFLRTLQTKTALGLSVLADLRYAVYISQFVLLIRAFAGGAQPADSYMGAAAVQFAKFIIPPFTLFDLGIREGAAVFFFSYLNVAPASAFNASILVYCINLLIPACLGLVLLLRLRPDRGAESISSADATLDPPLLTRL